MFTKGKSGNPAGRPLGATNNLSTSIKSQIESILTSQFSENQIINDLSVLEPKDRLFFYLKLLEYSVPKVRPIETKIEFSATAKQVISWGGRLIEI